MDFTGGQIAFIVLTSFSIFLLLVWHDKYRWKKLSEIEQTTWEPWMEYDNSTPDGDDSEDVYYSLREKFIHNYQWAGRVFGVQWCLIKDDSIETMLYDREKFNYKACYYIFRWPQHLPTCFRISEFTHKVTDDAKSTYACRGAELFMREFNEKVDRLRTYAEDNKLSIKYGLDDEFPVEAIVNCIKECTINSKHTYDTCFKVHSELLPKLLRKEKWKKIVNGSEWA
ncbi:hypothetical protein HOU35_gp045 [Acinetobacter phage vB_AbaM_B09_Aci05]|uniref:Uncharacterized protein n=1 Tax=Acinetobacter phage vB_AbaM_B09_Aci05 TaxID=2315458 RepID=A0A386KAU4_9CAUD|nr:hypothetical protein HOU35_gp045 [Acinetobacter phage vB_AbaM_B09_Aci05]AYD82345.1 hypothetical protein Aci05_132 [Acinetobacter phage vB_AbaM_B09_Aci05]